MCMMRAFSAQRTCHRFLFLMCCLGALPIVNAAEVGSVGDLIVGGRLISLPDPGIGSDLILLRQPSRPRPSLYGSKGAPAPGWIGKWSQAPGPPAIRSLRARPCGNGTA